MQETAELDELAPSRISLRRITISIGLPMSIVNIVDRIGEAEGVHQGRLFERLIRKGLAVERAERQQRSESAQSVGAVGQGNS